MGTFIAKDDSTTKKWYLIDLKGKVLGRAATEIAAILRGKDKATYTPHVDAGSFVIAINASQIKLTGSKLEKKKYYSHSGYIGGIKEITAEKLLAKKPEDLIKKAVKGMLPRNDLATNMLKKLKIYANAEHPHTAQNPTNYELKNS